MGEDKKKSVKSEVEETIILYLYTSQSGKKLFYY